MSRRSVSVPDHRYRALVAAAVDSPCVCAAPETRTHDGKCISCWAVAAQIARERELQAKPFTDDAELQRLCDGLSNARIARLEAEQKLRAEQIPEAARLLAEHRQGQVCIEREERERAK